MAVLAARHVFDEAANAHGVHLGRCVRCLALAFVANYGVLPNYDHRYRQFSLAAN